MTSPVSLPSGSKILAADLDPLENLTSAWQAYTPTWGSSGTAPALGNGTITGAYMQAGKLIAVRVVLTTGSTSTYGTGAWNVSLPVAPQLNTMLHCLCFDTSASVTYFGGIRIILAATSGDTMRHSTNSGSGVIGPTSPMTWASGDMWVVHGFYEAA